MREVVVISGKGGTGKTSLTAAFASISSDLVLADCDVDAPDLHILTDPVVGDEREFMGAEVATIDADLCTKCGECVQSCRFGAISNVIAVDGLACEACGVCQLVCPVDAVSIDVRRAGIVYTSETRFGPMVHAKLDPGEEVSGKLVSEVKKTARDLAVARDKDLILIDGPPGIGCSVIASISGADYLVVVTEPTISATEDMKRALSLSDHFRIPAGVCLNKSTINTRKAGEIVSFCRRRGTEVLGVLPYDHIMTSAMLRGRTVVELGKSEMADLIEEIWSRIDEGPTGNHI